MKTMDDILRKSLNKVVHIGDIATGKLTELHCDENDKPQYAIIATDHFPGRGHRYFAIPTLQIFLKVTTDGQITFKVGQDELSLAQPIELDKCNTTIKNDFIPSIYEISGYK